MVLTTNKKIVIGLIAGYHFNTNIIHIFSVIILAVAIPVIVVKTTSTKSTTSEKISPSFYVIPLGTSGGLDESNLSSYLFTLVNDNTPDSIYIALDSGTIRYGLEAAITQNSLPSSTDVETFIRQQIKAYLISHGHLDHITGFLINSPNDKSGKYIVGLNETFNIIQQDYFNNQAWADFGPTGLKTYGYQILDPTSTTSVPIANTDFDVRIFRLCHVCPYLSSAFLISRRNQSSAYVLYLGDTGPDDVEKIILPNNQTYAPRYLSQMWAAIRPLIAADQLKGIFIEVSYANGRPDNLLFGHLTPAWLLTELNVLRGNYSMEKVKIIITHIKPETGVREKIMDQLKSSGGSNFNFVLPQQGEAIWL